MIIFYGLHAKLLNFGKVFIIIIIKNDFKDGLIIKRPKVTHAETKKGTPFFFGLTNCC